MREVKVSIIVPNYNHARFLEQRLESIFNQSFKNFEVILLDDASTDNSKDILKRYADREQVSEFIINKENSGSPFKQWKKGIELAKGKYIWITESDDFCEIDFLEKIFDFINRSEHETEIVYTQSADIDVNGKILENRIYWTSEFQPNIWKENFFSSGEVFIQEFLKVKNVIPNASAVVFKKDLIDSKTFDKDLLNMKMCGDWLFWIRILKNAYIGYISATLNYFRCHSKSSREHWNLERKKFRFLEEIIVRKELQKNRLNQNMEISALYKKWNSLHPKKKIFHPEFYKILLRKGDFLNLIKITLKN